jgi:CheY-like chemotaxis protein
MHPSRALVLVVDDDAAICDLLRDSLQDEGYAVLQAFDGLEAIRAVDSHLRHSAEPAVVLLDLRLPTVDGFGVLNHVAAHGDRVAVVAISASPDQFPAATSAGARAVIAKPFDLDDVLTTVSRLVDQVGAHLDPSRHLQGLDPGPTPAA